MQRATISSGGRRVREPSTVRTRMGICAYVCAPWTVRALVYRRWKWLPVAFLLMWVSIDGVYSLYWWCRGFDALQIFRGANAIYCLPLYFALGFVMNFEMRRSPTK